MYIYITIKTNDTMKNLIKVSAKELKALTWMDDVTGMVAEDKGNNVEVYYSAMPSYWSQSFTKEEFLSVVINTTEKLN